MKKVMIIVITIILLCTTSCFRNYHHEEPSIENGNDTTSQGTVDIPEISIELVKFTDNKYREYILAEYITKSVTMRGEAPVAEELIVGTIPYSVELPNGYWAIDWRWGVSFIYPPSNVLLPYKWSSLEHWGDTWDKPQETMEFNEYIEEVRFVDRRSIDKYNSVYITNEKEINQLYHLPYIYDKYTTISEIAQKDKESYFNEVYRQDSLHSMYLHQLIKIINNGDFDKVSTIQFDNFYTE